MILDLLSAVDSIAIDTPDEQDSGVPRVVGMCQDILAGWILELLTANAQGTGTFEGKGTESKKFVQTLVDALKRLRLVLLEMCIIGPNAGRLILAPLPAPLSSYQLERRSFAAAYARLPQWTACRVIQVAQGIIDYHQSFFGPCT